MTVYDAGQLQCLCPRTLTDLYSAQGQPRTAQTFLCRGPGDVTVDMINVHAPSGGRRLSDQNSNKCLRVCYQAIRCRCLGAQLDAPAS